jgi:hypothetical protein
MVLKDIIVPQQCLQVTTEYPLSGHSHPVEIVFETNSLEGPEKLVVPCDSPAQFLEGIVLMAFKAEAAGLNVYKIPRSKLVIRFKPFTTVQEFSYLLLKVNGNIAFDVLSTSNVCKHIFDFKSNLMPGCQFLPLQREEPPAKSPSSFSQ